MAVDWHHMPSLTSLRAFEAVARLGGFSAAARALNVTHAAVAQQVRGLEDHLALALVRREGKALALTDDGEKLAASLAEGFGILQSGIEALRAGETERPVRVSLTASFAAQWLMPRLREFWALHPDIPLSLHPDARLVDLRRDGMDVAIRYGGGDWPGVEARYLTSGRLVVAAAPSLLGGRTGLTTPEMAALPWVLVKDWPEQNNWLRSLGLQPEALKIATLPTEELALAAAQQGLGLLVEGHALIEEDLAVGRLVLIHDRAERLPAYFTLTLPGPQRRAVRQFLSWLASSA